MTIDETASSLSDDVLFCNIVGWYVGSRMKLANIYIIILHSNSGSASANLWKNPQICSIDGRRVGGGGGSSGGRLDCRKVVVVHKIPIFFCRAAFDRTNSSSFFMLPIRAQVAYHHKHQRSVPCLCVQ